MPRPHFNHTQPSSPLPPSFPHYIYIYIKNAFKCWNLTFYIIPIGTFSACERGLWLPWSKQARQRLERNGGKKTVGFLKSDSTHKTSSNSHLTYQSQSSLSGDNVLLFVNNALLTRLLYCSFAHGKWQFRYMYGQGLNWWLLSIPSTG